MEFFRYKNGITLQKFQYHWWIIKPVNKFFLKKDIFSKLKNDRSSAEVIERTKEFFKSFNFENLNITNITKLEKLTPEER